MLAKLLRFIAICTLALVAFGAHARTLNAPLAKIDFSDGVCTLAQEAQVIDAPEEIASLYGDCASGTTINPYRYTDPDGRNPWAARLVFTASYEAATWAGVGIVGGLIGAGVYDLIHMNESAQPPKAQPKNEGKSDGEKKGGNSTPDLPDGLTGDNPRPGSGNRVNTDLPGGAQGVFDDLTGGKSTDQGNGTKVGSNGVRIRPGKTGEGPRVDIPAKGDRPHETIHFPPPKPPLGDQK